MGLVQPLVFLAANLRARADLDGPPFSPTTIIERCFPETLVTGDSLPAGIEAVAARCAHGPTVVYSRSLSAQERSIAVTAAFAQMMFGLDEVQAEEFSAELLAPAATVGAFATRGMCGDRSDTDDVALFQDMIDDLAARFVVPADIIELQIRRLRAV